MKKKTKIIFGTVISVIMILIVGVIIFSIQSNECWNKFIENEDLVFSITDELQTTDKYKNSSDEEKVDLMNSCLEELQNEGRISNLHYNDYIFHFDFAKYGSSEGGGGIVVKDTHNNCWSSTNLSEYSNSLTIDQDITDGKKLSAAPSEINKQDWSFLFGASMENDSYIYKKFEWLASEYNNTVTNIGLKTNSEISSYKSFENSGLIFIASHGFYDTKNETPLIWTQEEASIKKEKSKEYKALLKNKSINIYKNSMGQRLFVILPDFFQNYYNKNELENSIVLFAVCCLYGDNNQENYKFYNSLKNAGASTVIGFCNSVDQLYSILFCEKFLNCYLNGQTIDVSFDEAKEIIGENDNEFFNRYTELYTEYDFKEQPAYPILKGKTDIKFKDNDKKNWGQYGLNIKEFDTQQPIKDVKIILNKGDTDYATYCYKSDKNGFCKIELPAGKYTCVLNHNDYQSEVVNINIEANVITLPEDAVLLKRKAKQISENELLNYYWTNTIQASNIYEFTDDGTLIEYGGFMSESDLFQSPKSSWSESRRLKYTLVNNELLLDWEGDGNYITKLQYITKKENIKWDKGLTFYDALSDNDYFFYETDFVPSYLPENAMYLVKGKLKDEVPNEVDKSKSITEEEAHTLLTTTISKNDDGVGLTIDGFMFEEKTIYNGREYYAFRASHIVDGHVSYICTFFVAVDGSRIISGDHYGGNYTFDDNVIWEK